jgi:hypothetical protein
MLQNPDDSSASQPQFPILTDMTRLLVTALLIAAALGQSTTASSPPERFEYIQGHGLGGDNDRLLWEKGKLVLVKTDLAGRKEVEQLEPSSQAWEQFWKALDTAGIWKWKAEYPAAFLIYDGEGWSLEVRHAGRSLKSWGYMNQPPEFGAFRIAVDQLIKDSRSRQSRP